MKKVLLVASAVMLFGTTPVLAQSQAKNVCTALATGIPKAVLPLGDMEKALGGVDWDVILPHTTGQMRTNVNLAKQVQIDFLRVLRQYRIALEDVSYTAQLCAR